MSIFQLMKAAFTSPKELVAARKLSFPKTFLYLLFLSILLAIPVIVDLGKIVQTIQTDMESIGSKIPSDTSFATGELTTSAKDSGFIYQTDYLIFTFDPDNKTTAANIQDDLSGNLFAIGFLKNDFVFAYGNENILASSLPKSPIHLDYQNLDTDLVKEQWWGERMQRPQFIIIFAVITILFTLLPILLNLAITILLLSLIANLLNSFRGVRLKLSEIFKIMTVSATLAVLAVVLVELFFTSTNSDFILMMITIFTYFRVLPPAPRKPQA